MQKQYMIIEDLGQLKAISHPFRTKIISLLMEQSYTGQHLSEILEVPRSKIHYALNELEKHGFVQKVKTEEKGGIIQKYYRSTARGYIPSEKILPYVEDVSNYYRESALNILNRARIRALSAPEEAFSFEGEELSNQPMISMQIETKAREEDFIKWLKKYRKLVEEFKNMPESEDSNYYYLTTIGFQIDAPFFEGE